MCLFSAKRWSFFSSDHLNMIHLQTYVTPFELNEKMKHSRIGDKNEKEPKNYFRKKKKRECILISLEDCSVKSTVKTPVKTVLMIM